MNYFLSNSDSDLNMGFNDIVRKLSNVLPSYDAQSMTNSTSGALSAHTETFLLCMSHLERLLFTNEMDKAHTFNGTCYKHTTRFGTLKDRFTVLEIKTGLLINSDVSTHYIENTEAKHLPIAEEQFKVSSHHFLKIYTINGLMIVFTNKELPFETVVKLKLLQWSIFKDKIETPQQEIMDFIQAALKKDKNELNDLANAILNLPIIKEIKFQEIDRAFQVDYKDKLEDLRYDLEQNEQRVISKENELSRLIQKICEMQEQYEFLKMKSEQKNDNTLLLKWLSNHPYIKEVNRLGNHGIELYYEAPLIYYDEYIAKRLNYGGNSKKIIDIFVDAKYELMSRCKIIFDTNSFNINFVRMGNADFSQHPHIDRYGCFGNHQMAIHEHRKTNDYLGALEQITVAVLNLNFADGVVIDTMLGNLLSEYHLDMRTWRNKETGELKTTRELLEEYKNEETQTE